MQQSQQQQHAGGGGGFRFGFFATEGPAGGDDNDGGSGSGSSKAAPTAVASAAPPLPRRVGPWGREALLIPEDDQQTAAAGQQRVRVLWEESGGRQGLLRVRPLQHGDDGDGSSEPVLRVDPRRLRPLPLPTPQGGGDTAAADSSSTGGDESPSFLEEHDLVFDPAHAHTPLAPPLAPALESLVYPVTATRFRAEFWGRRALAVHATGGRARRVVRDLVGGAAGAGAGGAAVPSGRKRKRGKTAQRQRRQDGEGGGRGGGGEAAAPSTIDVAALLRSATRTVVWMRAQDGEKEMQYLDETPPEVAAACLRAGHSLYFNPPLAFQRRYVAPVLRALGLDLERGGGGGSLGGDVEVFAVKGPHSTPWHFDAQENITIQLRGCKRWHFRPSGLPDPLTNLHPASSNAPAVARDGALHAACTTTSSSGGGGSSSSLAPPVSDEGVATVLLRPGSVLYVPCGWWHRVESLGDHPEGSLSLNLSLDPPRWAGLLHRALGPALWGGIGSNEGGGGGGLRARAGRVMGDVGVGGEVEATRAAAGRMLDALRARLEGVAPEDLLPLAAFERGDEDGDEEEDDEEGEEKGAMQQRQQLVVVEAAAVEDYPGDSSSSSSDEDEDEDDEGGAGKATERRARARGSLQAEAGLSARAGWTPPSPQVAAMTFVRSPLAALVLLPPLPPPPSDARARARVGCLLHRGFGLDPLAAAPAVTVRIETAAAALPVLQALAVLPPGQRQSGAGLVALLDDAALVRKLVGVLVYHGYLRPVADVYACV